MLNLVAQFERWACGEDVSEMAASTTGSVVAATKESSTSPRPPWKNAEMPRATEEPNPSYPS